jgi:hypothetical protein
MLTIRPSLALTICFCTARVVKNEPVRWIPRTVSQSVSVILEDEVVGGHARVVDQGPRRTELGGDPADGRLDALAIGYLDADGQGRAALLLHRRDGLRAA